MFGIIFSEKSRVNLNLPIKSNEEFETDFVSKTIDRDRITIIRAALVRIMKAHQRLNEKLLIQNVIEQLKPRFSCQISVIKVIKSAFFIRTFDFLF